MIQSNRIRIKILKRRIARARMHLQSLWNAKGCTDAEVLEAGIKLDLLFNAYQRLCEEKEGGWKT